MLRGKHVNVVPFPFPLSPFPDYPWFPFLDLDVEGTPPPPQLERLREQLLPPLRPIQPHRLGARLQPERANQSDHAEEVVRVKMRKKNLGQRKAHPIAHHLALGPLTTLEQESLAFAHEGHRGDVALDRGASRGGSQKSDGKHGANIDGAFLASIPPPCAYVIRSSWHPSASATSWPCSSRSSSTSPCPTWRARSAPASPGCSGWWTATPCCSRACCSPPAPWAIGSATRARSSPGSRCSRSLRRCAASRRIWARWSRSARCRAWVPRCRCPRR